MYQHANQGNGLFLDDIWWQFTTRMPQSIMHGKGGLPIVLEYKKASWISSCWLCPSPYSLHWGTLEELGFELMLPLYMTLWQCLDSWQWITLFLYIHNYVDSVYWSTTLFELVIDDHDGFSATIQFQPSWPPMSSGSPGLPLSTYNKHPPCGHCVWCSHSLGTIQLIVHSTQ